MFQLRALREAKGIGAKEIAVVLGVSVQAVGKWERNEAFPRADQLPRLADLLGCSIDALYGRSQSPA